MMELRFGVLSDYRSRFPYHVIKLWITKRPSYIDLGYLNVKMLKIEIKIIQSSSVNYKSKFYKKEC